MYFDDRFLNKNGKRSRLIINKQLFPSILLDTQKKLLSSIFPTISAPQKPPTRMVPEEDQLQQYEILDNISNFSDVDESLLNALGNGFFFIKYQQATCQFQK